MNVLDVVKAVKARPRRKVLGRGIGCGHGKTSGRGGKGQSARTGYSTKPTFEGGQMPLVRRLPKRGFNNRAFRSVLVLVNLDQLADLPAGTVVDPDLLTKSGVVRHRFDGIKILGRGSLTRALTVKAHAFSVSAVQAIQKAGGTAERIPLYRGGPTNILPLPPKKKFIPKEKPKPEKAEKGDKAEKGEKKDKGEKGEKQGKPAGDKAAKPAGDKPGKPAGGPPSEKGQRPDGAPRGDKKGPPPGAAPQGGGK